MPTPYAIYCIIISVFTFRISAAPRALKEGQLPDDIRLLPLKDLNGYPWDLKETPVKFLANKDKEVFI